MEIEYSFPVFHYPKIYPFVFMGVTLAFVLNERDNIAGLDIIEGNQTVDEALGTDDIIMNIKYTSTQLVYLGGGLLLNFNDKSALRLSVRLS